MADPQQIKGLPPGAVAEPITGSQIRGLPPGASVEPIGANSGGTKAPKPSSPFPNAEPGSAQDVSNKLAATMPSATPPPLAPTLTDKLTAGLPNPAKQSFGANVWDAVKEGIYHPGAIKTLGNLAGIGGDVAGEQRKAIDAMGQRGELSPKATQLMQLPAGMLENTGQFIHDAATPGNAALSVAALHPALRLPIAAYGAVASGKPLLEGAANLQPSVAEGGHWYNPLDWQANPEAAKKLLSGASGIVGSAALVRSAKLPTPTNLRNPGGPPPLAPAEANARITRAVNPVPKDVNEFNTNLAEKGPEIAAHQSGVEVKDLPSLAKHLESVGDAQPYVSKILAPNAAKPAYPSQIPNYSGPVNALGDTTIGEMSAHLKRLNASMEPKYVVGPDGSMQQQAAINSQQMASMQAEAQAIRGYLGKRLSKYTGLPPEQVEAARSDWSKVEGIRDVVDQAANEAQFKANNAATRPPDMHTTLMGAGKVAGQKIIRAIQDRSNTPVSPNALIRDTFQRYKGQAPAPLTITPPLAPPARPAPAWQRGGSSTTNIPPQVAAATMPPSAPAIPAAQPGLLRPAGGTAPSSTSLPFGPAAASAPTGELAGRGMLVGEEHPEITGAPSGLPPEVQAAIFGKPEAPAPTAPTAPGKLTLGPGAEGLGGKTRSISRGGEHIGNLDYNVTGDTLTIEQALADGLHVDPAAVLRYIQSLKGGK